MHAHTFPIYTSFFVIWNVIFMCTISMWEFKHIKHMYRINCFGMNVCVPCRMRVCVSRRNHTIYNGYDTYVGYNVEIFSLRKWTWSMMHEWNSYNWYGIITVVTYCVKCILFIWKKKSNIVVDYLHLLHSIIIHTVSYSMFCHRE